MSIRKEGNSLKYCEDGRIRYIPMIALGFHGHYPIPRKAKEGMNEEAAQAELAERIRLARKNCLMETIMVIDTFRSAIKKLLKNYCLKFHNCAKVCLRIKNFLKGERKWQPQLVTEVYENTV